MNSNFLNFKFETASWSTNSQTTQWQHTTQPNFITKPRPSPWDKPISTRPKPKPSKKPILQSTSTAIVNTRKPSTVKPKPQIFHPKPTKPIPLQITTSKVTASPTPTKVTSTSAWTTSKSTPSTTTTKTTASTSTTATTATTRTTSTTTTSKPSTSTTILTAPPELSSPVSPSIFNLNNNNNEIAVQPNSVTISAARNVGK